MQPSWDRPRRAAEATRRRGIDLGEPLKQHGAASAFRFLLEPRAHFRVRRRAVEEALQQRFEIQRRAADEQDALAAPGDVLIALFRLFEPPGDARRLPRFEHIEEMMPHAPAVVDTDFREQARLRVGFRWQQRELLD